MQKKSTVSIAPSSEIKKTSVLIDKNGNIIQETKALTRQEELKAKQEARRIKLGM